MATNRDFTPVAPQRKTDNAKKITAIAVEAKRRGLSYGEYEAELNKKRKTNHEG